MSDHDLFSGETEVSVSEKGTPWKILVVDDEPSVLQVTRMVLNGCEHKGRPFQLIEASSAQEARDVLEQHDDIALALIDVVMETQHAGLDLVRFIRNELNNPLIRLVLRTGQPGEAPESTIVQDYEIDDYRLKTQITRDQLVTIVRTALNSYQAVLTLTQSQEQLRSAIEDLEHFNAIVAHDLQSPLRQVGTFAGLLTRKTNGIDDTDIREIVAHIQTGIKDMSGLIWHLLALSSIGREQVEMTPVELDGLIAEIIAEHQVRITSTEATIQLGHLPVIVGVRAYLKQLLRNLVINALKYSGVPQPVISVSVAEVEGHWRLIVADNGVGIDEKDQAVIFDIFQRGRNSGSAPGTGIGLAICKKVAEFHRGQIRLISSPEHGTRFEVDLPKPVGCASA